MKIVQMVGGIGNQMFQYAFLVSLREEFHQTVMFDDYLMSNYPLHTNSRLDDVFCITAPRATKKEIGRVYHHLFLDNYTMSKLYRHCFPVLKTEYREGGATAYDPSIFMDPSDKYYIGYWHDYRYLIEHSQAIKEELSFKKSLDKKNEELYESFLKEDTVSIHVRRGDYVSNPVFGGICDLEYYKKAIDRVSVIRKDLSFAIFSNDVNWCKENLLPLIGNKVTFVDWNIGVNSYKDIQLMTACKINIIANSSFSYWGGFLNVHNDSIVIAPSKWTNTEQKAIRQFPNWIKL